MQMERVCALATSTRLAGRFESDCLFKTAVGITCEAFEHTESRLDELVKRVNHLHGRVEEVLALLKKHNICPSDAQSSTSATTTHVPVQMAPPFRNLASVIGKFDGNPLHLLSWTRKVDSIWYASKDASYRTALLAALPKAMTGRAMLWLAKVGMDFRRKKPWPIWKLSMVALLGGRVNRKELDSGIVLPEFPESVKLIHVDDDDDEAEGQQDSGEKEQEEGEEIDFETLMRFFKAL